MLPELLLQILQGDSSSSQGTDSSHNNGARLNASDSDEEILTWFEPAEGVDYAHNAVTTVFNNPNLLSEIANFVPDPPRPPSPPPPPENAVQCSPRLKEAHGPPVQYREWETSRGHIYSFPLYAPLHPQDNSFDILPSDWHRASRDEDEYSDEEGLSKYEDYLNYLDREGDRDNISL